jgi:YD repeat-containing protein
MGRTTAWAYDGQHDVLSMSPPGAPTTTPITTYTYTSGKLTQVDRFYAELAQVQTTIYSYTDSAHPGAVTAIKDPNLNTTHYAYDARGNLNPHRAVTIRAPG